MAETSLQYMTYIFPYVQPKWTLETNKKCWSAEIAIYFLGRGQEDRLFISALCYTFDLMYLGIGIHFTYIYLPGATLYIYYRLAFERCPDQGNGRLCLRTYRILHKSWRRCRRRTSCNFRLPFLAFERSCCLSRLKIRHVEYVIRHELYSHTVFNEQTYIRSIYKM